MTQLRAYRARAALLSVLVAAGCSDRSPTAPPPGTDPGGGGPGGPSTTIAALTCTVTMADGKVACQPENPGTGAADGLIVGNQGIYVQLTSGTIVYDSGTGQFTFPATLQNLIEQPLGTTDGTTLDPGGIRIYFHQQPTVTEGTGSVAVVPDGFAFFTAAAQPYYVYPYLLDESEVSPAETWTFVVPPSVTRFVFSVYVAAPVEYPVGYITMDGELPGALHGALHPSTPHAVATVVKSAVGTVLPGTVAFGTADTSCGVNAGGTVTGLVAGTCTVTVTSGVYSGDMTFDVTGTQRTWNGSVSADWANGANWNGGYAPAAVDSAVIPTGVPNFPALTAATAVGGVSVADGATVSLGAFDLTASADVATGYTVGSGILGTTGVLELAGSGETVLGRVPMLRVTGDYALAGDLHVVAPGRVVSGRLMNVGYLFRTVSQ
jgi:hypothetical protein